LGFATDCGRRAHRASLDLPALIRGNGPDGENRVGWERGIMGIVIQKNEWGERRRSSGGCSPFHFGKGLDAPEADQPSVACHDATTTAVTNPTSVARRHMAT